MIRPPRTLADAWPRLRNRLFSDPRFQRWAATFPFTRRIARARASGLFDLCAGFVYSQVLAAVVELDLLSTLDSEPLTAAALGPRLSLSTEATRRLLDAAVSLELVDHRRDDRYGVGPRGAELLGNPSVIAMVKHHRLLYRDLADPVALLRGDRSTTELNRFWSYAHPSTTPPTSGHVAAYSDLMSASLALLIEDVLEAYPLDHHRSLLDVGGGDGTFAEAVANRSPRLALRVFDLPAVAERARDRFARSGLLPRCSVVAGDVFHDPLPPGADVISLLRVLHDHDDPAALQILRAVRRALGPTGTVLIAEPMSATAGAEPVGDAYFGFYLLAMGQGRPRTEAQLRALLRQAGFAHTEARSTRRPMIVRVLVARAASQTPAM